MTGATTASPAAGNRRTTARPGRLCLFVAKGRAAARCGGVFDSLPLFHKGGQRPL
jgi:hypothetical protein